MSRDEVPRLDWIAGAGGPIRGELRVPGDKSVSHRAIILGALAEGVSRVDGFLEGEDTRATAAAFAAMGVRIEAPSMACSRQRLRSTAAMPAPACACWRDCWPDRPSTAS